MEKSCPHANTLHTTIEDYDLHTLSIFTSLLHLYDQPQSIHEKLLSEAYKLALIMKSADELSNINKRTIEYSWLWISTVIRHMRYCERTVPSKAVDNTSCTMKMDLLCQLLRAILCRTDTVTAKDMNVSYTTLFIEATQYLGEIGMILNVRLVTYSMQQQHQILQSVVECFYTVLSSPYWTIRLHGLTALVQFASTISQRHASLLPKCVPSSMQKSLQCRLQNKIYFDDTTTMNDADVQLLQKQFYEKYLRELEQHAQRVSKSTRRYDNSLVEVPEQQGNVEDVPSKMLESYSVPAGSYCMTMPTQEGRNALVIFPPNAMDDIRTMIQQQRDDDDDDNNNDDDDTNNFADGTVEWMEEHNIQVLTHETLLSFGAGSKNM